MRFEFLGRGSAFNYKEGNNNAFYKNQNKDLLLIDCGESNFEKIRNINLLDDIHSLFIIITHTHSDHIGSLGSLCLFSYYAKKIKPNIVLTHDEQQNQVIKNVCMAMGLSDEHINFVTANDMLNAFSEFESFEFLESPHAPELTCYGFALTHKQDGITYFSADTNSSKYLELFLKKPNLDKIYIDTSKADYPGNVHLSFKLLQEVVPYNLRNKVCCMHIDNSDFIDTIKQQGFGFVDLV